MAHLGPKQAHARSPMPGGPWHCTIADSREGTMRETAFCNVGLFSSLKLNALESFVQTD